MRLDRFLTEHRIGSRSQVKEYIRKGLITVNGSSEIKPESKIIPGVDQICFRGEPLLHEEFQYFMLNKPQGVVSAVKDALSETVLSLLPKDRRPDLFPVGRLDKDTEGLLLITNDGELAHQLLSPKKHVSKTYSVRAKYPLRKEDIDTLESGVDIGDETLTLPAKVVPLKREQEGFWYRLSITEGRFHQVKRMLEAVNNQVLALKRVRFGPLLLDANLKTGECRRLTDEEVTLLREAQKITSEKRALIAQKKAVIFDLDGTLVDSMWIWPEIDREYLARFGYSDVNQDELRSAIEGMSFHETALYFQEHFCMKADIETMKNDWNQMAYDKYENDVPLKEGVLEFLSQCGKRGIRLGIATSNSRVLTQKVLSANGVEDRFDVIVTGSEITKGKPAPDIYLEAAARLGVSPSDCLVFEDIVPGIMAGKNAGMTVCAVADPDSENCLTQKKAEADSYILDYYDFFE